MTNQRITLRKIAELCELAPTTVSSILHGRRTYCSQAKIDRVLELVKQYELVNHQIIFTEPLSAVVTLSTDGTIEIDGMKGSFMYGVSREMTDNARVDSAGRPCTGNILSARIRLM